MAPCPCVQQNLSLNFDFRMVRNWLEMCKNFGRTFGVHVQISGLGNAGSEAEALRNIGSVTQACIICPGSNRLFCHGAIHILSCRSQTNTQNAEKVVSYKDLSLCIRAHQGFWQKRPWVRLCRSHQRKLVNPHRFYHFYRRSSFNKKEATIRNIKCIPRSAASKQSV